MIRSGIIVGAIAFVYLFVTSVAMPICAPLEAGLLGLFAGFLAAVFDKPPVVNKAALRGAIAGLITSIFAVIGGVAGYLIRVYVVFTPEATNSVVNQLLQTEPSASDATTDVLSNILSLGCCNCTNLMLIIGLGALGGYLWYRWKGPKTPAAQPPQGLS